ncbi:hypothetical protein SNEBB_002111 [Seison nebaliae]|nr:hypothetical protein SNEBB_002111 [Seison nebaliae]
MVSARLYKKRSDDFKWTSDQKDEELLRLSNMKLVSSKLAVAPFRMFLENRYSDCSSVEMEQYVQKDEYSKTRYSIQPLQNLVKINVANQLGLFVDSIDQCQVNEVSTNNNEIIEIPTVVNNDNDIKREDINKKNNISESCYLSELSKDNLILNLPKERNIDLLLGDIEDDEEYFDNGIELNNISPTHSIIIEEDNEINNSLIFDEDASIKEINENFEKMCKIREQSLSSISTTSLLLMSLSCGSEQISLTSSDHGRCDQCVELSCDSESSTEFFTATASNTSFFSLDDFDEIQSGEDTSELDEEIIDDLKRPLFTNSILADI